MSEFHRVPRAAYVHIPFCISKCHYCGFDSFAGLDWLFDDYVRALITEIELMSPTPNDLNDETENSEELESVYIGGGTPTVLRPELLIKILEALKSRFGIATDAEITVEANPGTVDKPKLLKLADAGFNRISIGAQSFDDSILSQIGRAHNSGDTLDAYQAAREAGFANIGIDLIFGLPGQSIHQWIADLETALTLHPEHVSLYELTIEDRTMFARMRAEGLLATPDEDAATEMYETAIARLISAGFDHYEVSNFAQPGFRSRHNQVYWRNEPYYGFGAAATSYVGGIRARRVADPVSYVKRILSVSEVIEYSENLTGRNRLGETLMLGLRMLEGVDLNRVEADTGLDIMHEFAEEVLSLIERELLELDGRRLRVTHRGLLLLDDVSKVFV
ncbi:MAG: radical SAM family heme chaperone HemW [Armatimonadetes bacterium]|nr:radical SAM family heme chaperone HemW [Armatimonadota bacterium]